jgi:hypothetical protein
MNNLKRFTVCKFAGHKWGRVAYQPFEDDTGYFLRCVRCGKEDHETGPPGIRGIAPPPRGT